MATAAFAFPSAAATVFCVAYTAYTFGATYVTFGLDAETSPGFGITHNSGANAKLNASSIGNVGLNSFYSTNSPKNAWHLVGGIFDRTLSSGESKTNVDGDLTGTQISNLDNTDLTFGTRAFGVAASSNGSRRGPISIGEILIYSRVLTTSERQIVEGYLAWRWNLQALLPGGHPYRNVAPGPGGSDDAPAISQSERTNRLRLEREARQRDDEESIEAVLRAFAHVVCR